MVHRGHRQIVKNQVYINFLYFKTVKSNVMVVYECQTNIFSLCIYLFVLSSWPFQMFFFANLLRTLECLFVNISIRVIGHVRRIRCTH